MDTSEIKYRMLVKVLDQLRSESPDTYKRYLPDVDNNEGLVKARSLAFIHLILKVKFGLTDFLERHEHITDETQDGGVDAYFIDYENKKLFFIQSKFRNTDKGFSKKNMSSDDLIKMEISRITKGRNEDSRGVEFNNKIKKLQNKITEIRDIAKYDYIVLFLGNVDGHSDEQIRRQIDNCEYEIYDSLRTYKELIFPLSTGTYYNPNEITIKIDLLEKEHPRLKQKIETDFGEYTVTAIFVPCSEIGRILSKYKNAILKYNPRNFLSLKKNTVNEKIRHSIVSQNKNNFAILNNGITLLSDNVYTAESTGEENKGQLILTRPQILNGGQTAFTLSTIYEENINIEDSPLLGKEVLLKIITKREKGEVDKEFIQYISNSTNQQSVVSEADRRSNHHVQIDIQKKIYEDFGFFYERKSGEFFNGISSGIISGDLVIDRTDFIKSYYAYVGQPAAARRSSENVLFKEEKFFEILGRVENYKEMFFSHLIFKKLLATEKQFKTKDKSISSYGYGLMYGKWAIIASIGLSSVPLTDGVKSMTALAETHVNNRLNEWKKFDKFVREKRSDSKYFVEGRTNYDLYYKVSFLDDDIKEFFLR